MVYSELGRFPLLISRKVRILKYWIRLLRTRNCILNAIYNDMYDECESGNKSSGVNNVKCMLLSLGFGHVWYAQNVVCEEAFIILFKQRLIDHFLQERNMFFDSSSKCTIYKHLVDNVQLQFYLTKNLSPQCIRFLTKYRLCSHKLNIEYGRFIKKAKNERLCILCNQGDIEDEFHFILKCPKYDNIRKMYIKRYYYTNASVFKLVQLLSTKNVSELSNLGKYLKYATDIKFS